MRRPVRWGDGGGDAEMLAGGEPAVPPAGSFASPEQRRRDYEVVSAALRELGNALVHEQTPTTSAVRIAEASVALARLAVCAGVSSDSPLPSDSPFSTPALEPVGRGLGRRA